MADKPLKPKATQTNTSQTAQRDSKGRFKKGNKPKNGFDKNPQNIAPGGFWRYKEHGKAAIIDIFKMTMAEFNSLKKIKDTDKTVLDQMLFNKFESAMNGNSRDADFLLLQAFGYAPKYYEAKFDYQADFKPKKSPLDDLTVDELRALLRLSEGHD